MGKDRAALETLCDDGALIYACAMKKLAITGAASMIAAIASVSLVEIGRMRIMAGSWAASGQKSAGEGL